MARGRSTTTEGQSLQDYVKMMQAGTFSTRRSSQISFGCVPEKTVKSMLDSALSRCCMDVLHVLVESSYLLHGDRAGEIPQG